MDPLDFQLTKLNCLATGNTLFEEEQARFVKSNELVDWICEAVFPKSETKENQVRLGEC